jgi:DNA-binding GntR family transcriptional regulator
MNSVTLKAYECLKNRILSGDLQPGVFLSSQRLSKEIGISRTPVVAAFRMLETDGLVTISPQTGAAVRSPDEDELLDLLEYRQALTVYATGKAAERRNQLEAQQLQNILEKFSEQISALSPNQPKAQAYKRLEATYSQFHWLIFQMARNALLRKRHEYTLISQHISVRARLAQRSYGSNISGRFFTILKDHKNICDGIRDGDALKAQTAASNHLKDLARNLPLQIGESKDSMSYSMEIMV